jgi:hypothetical protein
MRIRNEVTYTYPSADAWREGVTILIRDRRLTEAGAQRIIRREVASALVTQVRATILVA